MTTTILKDSQGFALNETGQVTLGVSPTLISIKDPTQAGVLITNPSSTVYVYIGGPAVTTATGLILPPGAAVTIPTRDAVYGVVLSSTQVVSFVSLTM